MLEMLDIKKSFGPNVVLRGVNLRVGPGSIHGLVGHNGAGKSTLMKILQGVHDNYEGTIKIDGQPVSYRTPIQARRAGVGMVFQEFSLIPTLTVSQNVSLGSVGPGPLRPVKDRKSVDVTKKLFSELGVSIDPGRVTGELSTAEQQFTEIAKALSEARKILVLDEPTAALTSHETTLLFETLRSLAQRGLSIIFITHRLREILEICDEVTVLRDGVTALNCPTSETTVRGLVSAMLGDAQSSIPSHSRKARAENLAPSLKVTDVPLGRHTGTASFAAYPGEIVGMVGLLGSGLDELADSLIGVTPPAKGEIQVNGKPVRLRRSADAVRAGLALVPSDNRYRGLIPTMNIESNIVLSTLRRLRSWAGLNRGRIADIAQSYVQELHIGIGDRKAEVTTLSGGNQRKVVVAKALATNAEILVFHDATAGVDVGAAAEIMKIARDAADSGKTVVWISSIFEEVIELADRILTIRDGAVNEEFANLDGSVKEEDLVHAVQ
jgi:ribose transport system ATP-binding protein